MPFKKMNLAIIGYGKMGRSIEKIANDRGHNVQLIIDQHNLEELGHMRDKKIDVAIEFTRPDSAFDNISKCIEQGVKVISGTTGWLDQYDEVVKLCGNYNGTFLCASNFSLGVNLFMKVNKWMASILKNYPQYVPVIEEIHHTEKLDKPSGTAISLAEGILGEDKRFKKWTIEEKEGPFELGIHSRRERNVPGTHTITYESDTDKIEIRHLAKSREGFALGAVLVAEWIIHQSGVLTIDDFLKL